MSIHGVCVCVGGGGWWWLVTQQADKLFEWDRQKLLAGKEKENSQIFNEDFYLLLYLPLCCGGMLGWVCLCTCVRVEVQLLCVHHSLITDTQTVQSNSVIESEKNNDISISSLQISLLKKTPIVAIFSCNQAKKPRIEEPVLFKCHECKIYNIYFTIIYTGFDRFMAVHRVHVHVIFLPCLIIKDTLAWYRNNLNIECLIVYSSALCHVKLLVLYSSCCFIFLQDSVGIHYSVLFLRGGIMFFICVSLVKKRLHCNENHIYVFPEKELRGLSSHFHIHVSVSDLYIPRLDPHIFL